MPLPYKHMILLPVTVSGVSTKTATFTKICTTENGTRNFYPLGAIIECNAAASVATVATVSIGTNATSYNNIVPATVLVGLLNTALVSNLTSNTAMTVITPNTDIYINITAIVIGTSQTITAYLYGFYA